jgi:hypothetical protein
LETFTHIKQSEFFVSGDYKSATDLLKMDVTLAILEGIIATMDKFSVRSGDFSGSGVVWGPLMRRELGP